MYNLIGCVALHKKPTRETIIFHDCLAVVMLRELFFVWAFLRGRVCLPTDAGGYTASVSLYHTLLSPLLTHTASVISTDHIRTK